jgi:tetratricopeptide (TPR) repeat protein
MDKLQLAITKFATDPENAELNFELALLYEEIQQTAAAISYFSRASERTPDTNLAYECLCKVGLCFERQGRRGNTVRGFYKHAICLMPKRPEAYFLLSRFYERTTDYVSAYLYAQQGLELADFNQKPLRTSVEYPGKYGLLFEKAVSAWWWGKSQEARDLFQELKGYASVMDQTHWQAVQRNLTSLGAGPVEHAIRPYNKYEYARLRYKFPGSETIERNYSQVYQDMFVLAMTDGKRDGTYVEVGSGDATLGSNSKLLEEWGWRGIGLEWNQELVNTHLKYRRNTVLRQDALQTDYSLICGKLCDEKGVIDYLQLDCEPSEATYKILTMIPFDTYKFRVVTFEHDHYVDMTGQYRELSRNYLRSKGYVMVVNDVSPDEKATFEDWWVNPQLVKPETLLRMRQVTDSVTNINRYMFPND